MRKSLSIIAAVACLIAGLANATLASARPVVIGPRTALVISGDTSLAVQYGQGWVFYFESDCGFTTYSVASGGKTLFVSPDTGSTTRSASVGFYDLAPLPVGTTKMTIAAATLCGPQSTSVQVKVSVAPLTLDPRIVADPNAPGNALVSATAKGDFVDGLVPTAYRGPKDAQFPSGTWSFTVTTADGKSVYAKKIAAPLGDPPYVSAYWIGTPPDQKLTAKAAFTPSGATAGDFAVSQPAGFDFTTADRPGQTLSRPADDGPPPGSVPQGFTVPLWSTLVTGLVGLAALLVGAVALVRLRRRLRRLDELVPAQRREDSRARA